MALKDIEGMITFTYYDDLEKAEKFYGEIMGFELVIDVDFAKVYKVTDNAHIGIVDGRRGSIKPAKDKPVMLTVVVKDIDTWYEYLKERDVDIFQPPKTASYLDMKTLLMRDPEGYILEILEFRTKPYGQ